MNIYVTRDSVAAGDDADAPHNQIFTVADGLAVLEIIQAILDTGYLASISGGRAAWSVVSGFPLAVVAQQWDAPKSLSWREIDIDALDHDGATIRLHFNYHTQIDPDVVYEVLWRLKLRAE